MPSARLCKFRILTLVSLPLGAFVSNMGITRYDFLRYYVKHPVISHPSQTDIRLCYTLPKIAPSSLPNFLGDAFAFSCFERITKKHGRYGNHYRLSGTAGFQVLQFSEFPRNRNRRLPNCIALVTSIIPRLSCRPIGFRRDNDSPIRFSLDATAVAAATAGNPNSLKDRVVIFG